MSGKTKLDIVRDGLVCHFDAANQLSIKDYLPYADTNTPTDAGGVLNVAKITKENISNKHTALILNTFVGNDDYTIYPGYKTDNYGYFDFSSGSAGKAILYVSERGMPERIDFTNEFTVNIGFKMHTDPDKEIMLLQYREPYESGSLWIRPASFGSGEYYNIVISANTTIIPPGIPGFDWNVSQQPITTGSWYNVSLTMQTNSSNNDLYINGVKDYRISTYITSSGTISPLWIGNSPDGNTFGNTNNFGISYISFYNRKLTESEVIQNYNALKYRFIGALGAPYLDDHGTEYY